MRNRAVLVMTGLLVGGLVAAFAVPALAGGAGGAAAAGAVAGVDAAADGPTDVVHRSRLTGEQETQAGDPDGVGHFSWVIRHKRLCYLLTVRGIQRAQAAHIHKGRRGVAGDIVVGLKAPRTASARCMRAKKGVENTMDVLTRREARRIKAHPARYYVNVHNATYPAGALRGQLD